MLNILKKNIFLIFLFFIRPVRQSHLKGNIKYLNLNEGNGQWLIGYTGQTSMFRPDPSWLAYKQTMLACGPNKE